MCIGSWNLGVPEPNSCMGQKKGHFAAHLHTAMGNIATDQDLDVLISQEVNKHWAEEAHRALQLSQGQRWNFVHADKKATLAKEIGSVG